MSKRTPELPQKGIQRIVDLEKLRTRRRTLKRLLIGSGAMTIGASSGLVSAQQMGGTIPPIVDLILNSDSTPAPTTLVLNETSYTGTSSQSFTLTMDGVNHSVMATASACFEVVSSTTEESVVDIDLIIILEGLSAFDINNDDPAIEYYIRRADDFPEEERLENQSIIAGGPNQYIAHGGPDSGATNSCGLLPSTLSYSLRIENNLPVMVIAEQSRGTNSEGSDLSFTVPAMTIALTSGNCAHPTRFETSCSISSDGGDDDDVGIIILTTPDPMGGGGPIG